MVCHKHLSLQYLTGFTGNVCSKPHCARGVIVGNAFVCGWMDPGPRRGAVLVRVKYRGGKKPSGCFSGRLQPQNYCCDSLDDITWKLNNYILSPPVFDVGQWIGC